jgi:hypothetical protein
MIAQTAPDEKYGFVWRYHIENISQQPYPNRFVIISKRYWTNGAGRRILIPYSDGESAAL